MILRKKYLKLLTTSILFTFSSTLFAVPVTFFTDRSAGLAAFTSAISAADTNYNARNSTSIVSTVYSFPIPNTSLTNGIFSVTAGSTTLYIKTTLAGSAAPNNRSGDLGGTNFTSWSVSYQTLPGGATWANALAKGYKVEFFSDAGLTTAASINSFGINIDDWGTCCNTVTSATPTGTTTGTGVYLVFDNGSTLNPLEVGTMTTTISGTEHFVGAIDDRNNNFQAVTLVPTGIGERFGAGSTIYFSTVQIGSAVASSGVNTVTSSAVNITTTHGKTYTDLGTTLNRVFDGGTLIIPIGAGATFTDVNAFAVNNVSGNTLQIDSGVSATFGGVFSGVGSLTKTGDGTLIFSGANTYTGATTISVGTLTVSGSLSDSTAVSVESGATYNLGASDTVGSIAGAGTVALNSYTLTAGGLNTNTAVSGTITGTGGLTKIGTGTLTLTGVNTYSGATTVNAGTLVVGSSSSESTASIAGSTSVSLGATLAGYGTVGAAGTTLTNSGTVAPGNSSIASLSVGGAYVQNSGGNLAIGLTPTTNDLLAVNEDASLAGTVTVTGASGTYSPTRYTLVTSGGRTGTFDTLSTNIDTYTTLGYFLSYDNNNAYLTLGPDYINTTSALLRNFEQMKSIFASQAGLQISGLNYDCSTFGENNVCLSTGGRTSHVFNKSDAFDGQTPMMQSALLIGAYRIDPTIRLGGWIDQNINTQNANIKMSNPIPMFGIFGVYDPSGNNTEWQLKASASYSEKDLNITRQQLQNTEAGFGKTTFKGLAAQLDVAYTFAGLVPDTFVSPTVGVRYYSGHTNEYSEESTSTVQVPVSYNKFKEASGVAFAGLKLDGDILPQLKYSASAGVETDVKRSNPTYSGTSSIFGLSSFNIQGNSSPRDTRAYANAGLGYIIDKTQSINFGVYYREDQFRNIDSFSSILTYTIGL